MPPSSGLIVSLGRCPITVLPTVIVKTPVQGVELKQPRNTPPTRPGEANAVDPNARIVFDGIAVVAGVVWKGTILSAALMPVSLRSSTATRAGRLPAGARASMLCPALVRANVDDCAVAGADRLPCAFAQQCAAHGDRHGPGAGLGSKAAEEDAGHAGRGGECGPAEECQARLDCGRLGCRQRVARGVERLDGDIWLCRRDRTAVSKSRRGAVATAVSTLGSGPRGHAMKRPRWRRSNSRRRSSFPGRQGRAHRRRRRRLCPPGELEAR